METKPKPFGSQLPAELQHQLKVYAVSVKRRVHEVLADAVSSYLKRKERAKA